jgi:hypothetical protein
MRRAARRDGTHQEVADTFTELGCSVEDVSTAGIAGLPDMIVGCIGVNHLVEAKDLSTDYGRRGFNPNQVRFNERWRGERVWIATDRLSAAALVANWRKAA